MSQRHAFPIVPKNFFHPKFKQILDIYTRRVNCRSPIYPPQQATANDGLQVEKAEIENLFSPICLGQIDVETSSKNGYDTIV
jgi:hypothetical protein